MGSLVACPEVKVASEKQFIRDFWFSWLKGGTNILVRTNRSSQLRHAHKPCTKSDKKQVFSFAERGVDVDLAEIFDPERIEDYMRICFHDFNAATKLDFVVNSCGLSDSASRAKSSPLHQGNFRSLFPTFGRTRPKLPPGSSSPPASKCWVN